MDNRSSSLEKPPIKHELMHLIAMLKWGYPHYNSIWINEDLAAFAEDNCNGYYVAQIYRYFMDTERLIHIDSLATDFYNQPEMIAYHQSAYVADLLNNYSNKTTYAFNSLMDSNAKVAFGSDWWVAPASPLYGIYAAVTRRTLDGKNPEGWIPEQIITVEQALNAYTKNGAYASFEEDIKGTLAPGKLADFVVLDDDITKVDPIGIKDIKVLQTYVAGKKVFDAEVKEIEHIKR